jgi:tetratricopeptide (TPR) repeat protein
LNSKNFFNANEYFEKSRVSFEKFFKTSKNVYVAECYNFIGLSKFHLNEIEEAKKFFDKSLEIYNYFLISEINLRTVQVYSNLTMYYRKLNNSQEESKYNEKVSFIKNQIHKEIQNLRNFGLQIEEKVGNYTLKEKIGSGGFGDVYMVEHNINKNM